MGRHRKQKLGFEKQIEITKRKLIAHGVNTMGNDIVNNVVITYNLFLVKSTAEDKSVDLRDMVYFLKKYSPLDEQYKKAGWRHILYMLNKLQSYTIHSPEPRFLCSTHKDYKGMYKNITLMSRLHKAMEADIPMDLDLLDHVWQLGGDVTSLVNNKETTDLEEHEMVQRVIANNAQLMTMTLFIYKLNDRLALEKKLGIVEEHPCIGNYVKEDPLPEEEITS
uniref:ORF124 n=1 Tax=Malaco herpesvirus 1 TaxID=3031797 RepID=A0AA48SF18_9VIRU|nr:TPA_asm: ORF124 [Malaco herpesvirus 1]